jgi:hypothetical protein
MNVPLTTEREVEAAWGRLVSQKHSTARIEVGPDSVAYLLALVKADRGRRIMDMDLRRKFHFLGQQGSLFGE